MTVATFAEKNRVLHICVCMYIYIYIIYMPSSGSMPNLLHANLVYIFCYSRVSALHNTFGANKNYPAANIGREEEAANIKKQEKYKLLVSGGKFLLCPFVW